MWTPLVLRPHQPAAPAPRVCPSPGPLPTWRDRVAAAGPEPLPGRGEGTARWGRAQAAPTCSAIPPASAAAERPSRDIGGRAGRWGGPPWDGMTIPVPSPPRLLPPPSAPLQVLHSSIRNGCPRPAVPQGWVWLSHFAAPAGPSDPGSSLAPFWQEGRSPRPHFVLQGQGPSPTVWSGKPGARRQPTHLPWPSGVPSAPLGPLACVPSPTRPPLTTALRPLCRD